MKDDIMPRPLAQSLVYFLDITQDAAHRKGKLQLKVDVYFVETKDVLLLKSIVFSSVLLDKARYLPSSRVKIDWKCA